jgi:hypothetical protein
MHGSALILPKASNMYSRLLPKAQERPGWRSTLSRDLPGTGSKPG